MLKPDSKEKENLEELMKTTVLVLENLVNDSQENKTGELMDNIYNAARPILKREWERVKSGE
jgi:hypothetical protein